MTFIPPHYLRGKKNAMISFFKKDHFLVKTPWWLKRLFPGCVWDMPKEEKTIYLTFDDGPHPTITPFILDELRKHNAKATFFCIGENVIKYPEVFRQILAAGHSVGNHTHRHVNGWRTEDEQYVKEIEEADTYILSSLFRPPYGRIRRTQLKQLQEKHPETKVVMWNVLAGDWVTDLSPERCFRRVKRNITAGDIIVFHDSEKAWDRMSFAVPLLLKDLTEKGYRFERIKSEKTKHPLVH